MHSLAHPFYCKFWLSCCCLILLNNFSAAEEINLGLSEKAVNVIDQAVAQEMSRQELVGVAIGIIQNGRVAFTRGYGLADRERKVPVTTESIFNWASNSKPVIGMLAMQLVEQGRLDLDADVRTYVPDFPDKGATITTRQLLSHQSGLPHYSNGKVVSTPGTRTLEQELDPLWAMKRFDHSPLVFPPGAKADYSSHAYVLLSAVVQQSGEEPLAIQLDKRIVQPLGLRSFQLDLPIDGQPSWVQGYQRNLLKQVVLSPEYAHAWKHGAGGYKSDINDFARWGTAILNQTLLKPATQRQMWTPQKTADGKRTQYGLGVVVEGMGRELKISHNGSQPECNTRLVLYPNQKHGMVVLSNCQHADPGSISTAIYRALASVR